MPRYLFITLVFFFHLFLFFQIAASEFTAEEIKSNPTFHQRGEGFTLSLTPEEMEYFLDNLDHASFLLNVYNIHTLRIRAMGDNVFYAEDNGDLSGNFYLFEKNGRFRNYRGEGTINNRLIGSVSADVIASIHYRKLTPDTIVNDLEFWVKVNSSFLDFLCRIFQPLLIRAMEKKFTSLIDIFQTFAGRIRSDPEDAMHQLEIYMNSE